MKTTERTRSKQPFWPWMGILGAVLLLLILAATGMGFLSVSVGDVTRVLLSAVPGMPDLTGHLDRVLPVVIRDVRLPRILCAAIVGGGLSISGAVFQGILLNPLADPYTLGVSAGAAFGASVAFLLKLNAVGISVCAFLGAMLTLVFVLYLASTTGGFSSTNLILAGIITAAVLSAGISFLKYIADEQVSLIIFWLMGSFASRTWYDTGVTFLVVVFGFLVLMRFSRDINLLVLGERTAASLGVHPQRVIAVSMVAASLVAAVCVSVSGIIGFVGLLVPHIVRSLFGPDHRRLIPLSLLMGAIALLGADTVTRAILPKEIPIGVVTALTGGPFFCYVLKKKRMGASAWSGG